MAYKRLPAFDGERLRRKRWNSGLRMKDLEERTAELGDRIRASLICRYENGEFGPNAPRAKVLADALNCTIDDLLTPPSEAVKECA